MVEANPDREAILMLCRKLERAHADRDARAIAACYGPGAVIYGLAPPLAEHGLDVRGLQEWLDTWEGAIVLEVHDDHLELCGSLAWRSALTHMCGSKAEDGAVDLWFRTTTCFAGTVKGWRIVHEHASVPFYMDGSFLAAVDLTPGATPAWNEASS